MSTKRKSAPFELAFNLWAIFDGGGQFVYALSGKVYVLSGTDDEKLAILGVLAKTDHVTAKRHTVPARFKIVYPDGESVSGGADLSAFANRESRLFEELFHTLIAELPPISSFTVTEHVEKKQVVPDDPLCATTLLYEDEFGVITPIVSQEDREWMMREIKGICI